MAKHAHSLRHRPTHHASGWRDSKIVLAETGGRFQTTVQSFIGTMMMTTMIQNHKYCKTYTGARTFAPHHQPQHPQTGFQNQFIQYNRWFWWGPNPFSQRKPLIVAASLAVDSAVGALVKPGVSHGTGINRWICVWTCGRNFEEHPPSNN